jgi:hypothetical protein
VKLLERTVASAHATVAATGLVELSLQPTARYRSLVRGGGLYARIVVSFTAPGQPQLSETLLGSFREAPAARRGGRR